MHDKNKMKHPFNRRLFLGAAAALAGSASIAKAQAIVDSVMSMPGRSQWNSGFDAQASGGKAVATNLPILSFATVAYAEQALQTYSDIVARGGWNTVRPTQQPLRIGSNDQSVVDLRRRLFVSGDLAQSAGLSPVFDTYVDAAVKRFQARHGITADGAVGNFTFKALNVPAAARLQQLRVNLARLNTEAAKTQREQRYVIVNIPAADIEAVENGQVVLRHTAVVGKIDRQTPLLDSKIHQIVLNPFWTVPKSIIRKDIIPVMQKNPSYLTDNKIYLYDSRGQRVAPESVDWNTDEAVRLMFRQEPGKINAMSSTKIDFHNPYAVYMHDTPQQTMFNNLMRFDSSGCIRVQNIRDLNQWILKNTDGWDRVRMEQVINSRENTFIRVKDPVPLHFVYISAWATGNGVVQFRDDIYNKDGANELNIGTSV